MLINNNKKFSQTYANVINEWLKICDEFSLECLKMGGSLK
jgi:hypothetical protein